MKHHAHESWLECCHHRHRLKQHQNLNIKSKCYHLGMQISTFDFLIKTLFTYVNFIDESRKKMILETRKFHEAVQLQHQRRIHATFNFTLMSIDDANKSQNIQRHHRKSVELINSFSCDNFSPTTSQKSDSCRCRHLSIEMFFYSTSHPIVNI